MGSGENIDRVRIELDASVEKFRFLAETIPVQIWTALPDGSLDFVTEQTAQQFGVSTETILRDGWKDVVHPDDLATAGAAWMNALATGQPYEVQFRVRMADGSFAWHLVRAVAQKSESGDVVRWFGTNTNIDAERESQRRVKALLDEVTIQSKEYEATVVALRARIAELEKT